MTIFGSAIPLPTTAELAWLAGFIDGEGSFGLHVRRKTKAIQPRLSVPNTNRRSIERVEVLLRALVGRKLKIRTCKGASRTGFRPYFVVELSSHSDLEGRKGALSVRGRQAATRRRTARVPEDRAHVSTELEGGRKTLWAVVRLPAADL